MFLLWLGEQITSPRHQQWLSLVIFADIVAELPRAAAGLLAWPRHAAGAQSLPVAVVLLVIASRSRSLLLSSLWSVRSARLSSNMPPGWHAHDARARNRTCR
ncbi:MAG: hypothetical protein R3C60_14715 [Parvularculaceae bacterium]